MAGRSANVGLSRRPPGQKADRETPRQVPKMPFPRASRALERITVLDLTRVRSGPTCVRQLCDWGANIIKVEMREGTGDAGAADFSARPDPDFQNLQRGKRSIAINLKDPEGLAILYR